MTNADWTPEKRAEREIERAAVRLLMKELGAPNDKLIDRLFPEPPPEHTDGREIDSLGHDSRIRHELAALMRHLGSLGSSPLVAAFWKEYPECRESPEAVMRGEVTP